MTGHYLTSWTSPRDLRWSMCRLRTRRSLDHILSTSKHNQSFQWLNILPSLYTINSYQQTKQIRHFLVNNIYVNRYFIFCHCSVMPSPGSPAMTISPLALATGQEFTFPPSSPDTKHGWELKRREAVWDLFQSESAFLRDHLMALKNVRVSKQF